MIVKFLKDTECKYMFGSFDVCYRGHDVKFLEGTEIGVIKLLNERKELKGKMYNLLCFTDNRCNGNIGYYSDIPLENISITKDCRSSKEIQEAKNWDNFKPGDMK